MSFYSDSVQRYMYKIYLVLKIAQTLTSMQTYLLREEGISLLIFINFKHTYYVKTLK